MQLNLFTAQYCRSNPNAVVYHKRTLFIPNAK
jgi:hypothetical protein